MSVYSGTTAKISLDGSAAVQTVRNWKITETTGAAVGGASSLNQGMDFSVAGVKGFTGSFDFYGKTLPVVPGATDAGSTTFVGRTPVQEYGATIFPTEITITCDIEGGGLLSGSCNFVGNSVLTPTNSLTVLTDASVPNAYPSVGCKAQWATAAASPSFADIAGVRSWSLTITCGANPYSTADDGGIQKHVGGRKSAKVSINTYQASPYAMTMVPGAQGAVKLFVDASTFWEFRWVQHLSRSPDVDIETGKPSGISHEFGYTGWAYFSSVQNVGYINKPGATAIWP